MRRFEAQLAGALEILLKRGGYQPALAHAERVFLCLSFQAIADLILNLQGDS